jgi:hypothetical protein
LIATLAQGRRWFAEIQGGKANSLTGLSERQGVDRIDILRRAVTVPDWIGGLRRCALLGA